MAFNLKEAIEIIESGGWQGPIRFITADVNKGTGGKVLEIPKFKIARREQRSASEIQQPGSSAFTRNPNHSLNFTRNIELPNHEIRKVHPILITHLNNQPVL